MADNRTKRSQTKTFKEHHKRIIPQTTHTSAVQSSDTMKSSKNQQLIHRLTHSSIPVIIHK